MEYTSSAHASHLVMNDCRFVVVRKTPGSWFVFSAVVRRILLTAKTNTLPCVKLRFMCAHIVLNAALANMLFLSEWNMFWKQRLRNDTLFGPNNICGLSDLLCVDGIVLMVRVQIGLVL